MTIEHHSNYYFIRWGWRRHTEGVDIFTPKRVYLIRW